LIQPLAAQMESLPPEIRAQIQARLAGGNQTEATSADSSEAPKKPEDIRLDLLKKLTIDRTNAGILQSRLGQTRKKDDEAEKPEEKSSTPEEVEIAKIKKDISHFQLNLNLGEWKKAGDYLATLEENEVKVAYDRILQQLAATVNVVPRSELAAAGAQPHRQKQYVRAADVLAISNLSPKEPNKSTLNKLSKLRHSIFWHVGTPKPTGMMRAMSICLRPGISHLI